MGGLVVFHIGVLLSHPHPCPLHLKVKGDFNPGSEEEKSRILAVVSGGGLESSSKTTVLGEGLRWCSGVLPSRDKPERSCLQETSPGPLGIFRAEGSLAVCLPLPPYPIDLSLPPSSLPFSALLPGAEDEVAMGT